MTIPQSLDEQTVESGPPVSLRERTLRPDESAARAYAAPDEPPAINLRANQAAEESGEPAFDVTTVMERAMIDGTHAGWKDRRLSACGRNGRLPSSATCMPRWSARFPGWAKLR